MYKKLIVLLVVLICSSNFCLGQNHLKILTWNIQMLPGIVNKCYNREKRCIGIIKNIKDSDYDIIVFQEVFYVGIITPGLKLGDTVEGTTNIFNQKNLEVYLKF